MSVAQLVECTRGGGGTVRDAVVAKTVKTQHVPLKGVNGKKRWRSKHLSEFAVLAAPFQRMYILLDSIAKLG